MKKLLFFSIVFLLIFHLVGCSWFRSDNLQTGAPKEPIKEIGKTPDISNPNPNWLMWGHDSHHTSATSNKIKSISNNPLWTFSFPDSFLMNTNYMYENSPLVYGNFVFYLISGSARTTGKLLSINRADGTKSWEYGFTNADIFHATPVIAVFPDKQFIIVCSKQKVSAIDLKTHRLAWQKELSGSILKSPTLWFGKIPPNEKSAYYIFVPANGIFCIRAEDGLLVWQSPMIYNPTSPTVSTDLESNNQIFVATTVYQRIYRLNINSGALEDSYGVEGNIFSDPVIYKDWVYFGCGHGTGTSRNPLKGHFYCITRSTLDMVWKFSVDNTGKADTYFGEFNTSPCVLDKQGYLYVACSDGWLYCFNHTKPVGAKISPIWKFRLHYDTASRHEANPPFIFPVMAGNTEDPKLVVSVSISQPKKLFLINPLNGAVLWTLPELPGYGFFSSPVISYSSVFIEDRKCSIYRYDP